MVYIEELRLAMKYTEEAAARGTWNQDQWLSKTPGCGTAGCLAGNYALATGCEAIFARDNPLEYETTATILTPAKVTETVREYAQRNLGLTGCQAVALFDCNNTLDDLQNLVAEFIADEEAKDV